MRSLFDIARTAFLRGNVRAAYELFSRHVQIAPNDSQAWFYLGVISQRLEQFEAARQAFERVLSLSPENIDAMAALSSVKVSLGDMAGAIQLCKAAIAISPDDPNTHANLGVVLEAAGNTTLALESYDTALQLEPRHLQALLNRGNLLAILGELSAAIICNKSLVDFHPEHTGGWLNLGHAYLQVGQYADAHHAFRQVTDRIPEHGDALILDSLALSLSGDAEEAHKRFDLARSKAAQVLERYESRLFLHRRGAEHTELEALVLLHLYERHLRCDWGGYAHLIQRFAQTIELSPTSLADPAFGFRALALGLSPSLLNKLAGEIAKQFERPSLAKLESSPVGKIRVGYLSADFRSHPVGYLLKELFKRHDRSRFVVHAYSIYSAEDDEVQREICAGVDRFVDLSWQDDEAASKRILDDRLDILIDLCGYTEHARPNLLARRPAATQIAWMGYLAPTSPRWIDYVILDLVVAPPTAEEDWGEKILRMPHSLFFCSYAESLRGEIKERHSGILLAAPHHPRKLDPDTFAIWMRLMRESCDSRLWLMADSHATEKNLRNAATAQGVDSSRLMFTGRLDFKSYQEMLAQADLFLDTPLYNGGATVCDAIAAGVPVLTLMGDSVTQRMAASILLAADFAEGIAQSAETYEQKALAWLSEPTVLAGHQQKLLGARGKAPFYRLSEWVLEFEQVLQKARQRSS